ncbi:hypothetical protein KO494_11210 [Lacinutrix sp. C3R15]|uniref:hypothetical protein n=1 Tax=Flavobacteriaceae TaxID=49546 RepID=UPI001C08CF24|nr:MULTISPECIES: hypothetical protein [Flavobacteriaceae]MBU2940107.1 hypothetical protein [Lacinutrix sp. C3R15]MDO6623424.1 hypothetical protein [Oceanihabitans sp. 1_MG-2023]
MNRILMVLLFLCVSFINCDGRDKAKRTAQQDFRDSTILNTFNGSIKYFPEKYTEVVTDTTLSNGFKINIKTYTDMNNSVLNTFKTGTIKNKHYYRDAISNIKVSKNGEIIFSERIDKSFFLKLDKSLKDYFKVANLTGVWLQDEKENLKNSISIYIMFAKPETDYYMLNKMTIDTKGKYTIEEIEQVN